MVSQEACRSDTLTLPFGLVVAAFVPPFPPILSTRPTAFLFVRMKMKLAIETRQQAYKRITDGIRQFVNHSVGAMKLVQEAKRLEIWKDKWSSWQEYCEKEFGKSRQRAWELLDVASTIDEIKSVRLADIESGKNKAILDNLNRRQADALKGLPPVQKAEVLAKAIQAQGGKSPKPETINGVRRACAEFGDGTYRGHDASDFYTQKRDEIDPADKISSSTKDDVAAAQEVSERYPKVLSFEVITRQEEVQYHTAIQDIIVKRGTKPTPRKIDMHEAVRSVCVAYKRVTGKTMSVKPLDAGQLRRLLESGIELQEFIEVGEKAWKSGGFLAKHSHQIAMFVKHYGNIRNEIESPKNSLPQNNQIKETINVRTL